MLYYDDIHIHISDTNMKMEKQFAHVEYPSKKVSPLLPLNYVVFILYLKIPLAFTQNTNGIQIENGDPCVVSIRGQSWRKKDPYH